MKKPERCCDKDTPLTDDVVMQATPFLQSVIRRLHNEHGLSLASVSRLLMMSGVGLAVANGADLEWITRECADGTAQAVLLAEKLAGKRLV
jgi:hypothetical protein